MSASIGSSQVMQDSTAEPVHEREAMLSPNVQSKVLLRQPQLDQSHQGCQGASELEPRSDPNTEQTLRTDGRLEVTDSKAVHTRISDDEMSDKGQLITESELSSVQNTNEVMQIDSGLSTKAIDRSITHDSDLSTSPELIIDLIRERAKDTKGSTSRLEKRLDNAYATLEWWEAVGCEFCFVMNGNAQPGHAMEKCDRWHGCDKARSILKWLESLSIPKFLEDPGSCSMCTHTWFPCGDICLSQSIHDAGSKQEKARLVKELQSQPSFDGHCERKPIMRRVIAALCSYDDQFFAKMLAKLASDNDDVDLSLERSATPKPAWGLSE
ncbi:hypothetical protein CDV36_015333 [Fusarium kuroshium]|uniref:Uncharacterized protein n=1 Tax=Fusarium kuroshium TaxID=2010991 RepID=A0A3M2RAT6_9HYPO|nr:hypothetical protein CDV36_015333 [Fusarium kuroshium]